MVNGSTHAIKKHDRDHEPQRRVREFKNQENWDEWSSCEMYGHSYQDDGDVRRCPCGDTYEP